jgi:hypothetical protein
MKQESRYSDVLSESQIARMGGNSEGRREGIAEGLRMAAEIVASRGGTRLIVDRIYEKAKEVEEAKGGE